MSPRAPLLALRVDAKARHSRQKRPDCVLLGRHAPARGMRLQRTAGGDRALQTDVKAGACCNDAEAARSAAASLQPHCATSLVAS
jgi:hypothetical protein